MMHQSPTTQIAQSVRTTTIILITFVTGCESNLSPSNSTESGTPDGPWVTIDEDAFCSVLTGRSDEALKFTVKNLDLDSLLESMCNQYNVRISVRPAALLEQGINIEVTGVTALDALTDLANQASLAAEQVDETHFRLHKPDSDGAPEKTISPVSY